MSRRRIRDDASRTPTTLNASSSSTQANIQREGSPVTSPLTRATAGVSGSAYDNVWTASGSRSKGKKTPLT